MGLITKVHRMIHEKMDMEDKELFLSEPYKEYLKAFLEVFHSDYNRRVNLCLIDDPKVTAFTNGENVTISVSSELVEAGNSRAIKNNAIKGLLVHEMGHILFTNFPVHTTAFKSMQKGYWYPSAPYNVKEEISPEADATMELETLMKTSSAVSQELAKILHNIVNIVEDAYIETRMADLYPGVARFLATCAATLYDNMAYIDVEEKNTEKKTDPVEKSGALLTLFFSSLLHYARFGEVKLQNENSKSAILDAIYSCVPFVDSGIINPSAFNRCQNCNKILVAAWPFMKDLLEAVKDQQKDCDQQTQNQQMANALNQAMDNAMQGGCASSVPQNRGTTPVTNAQMNDASAARQKATGNANASLCATQENASASGGSGASASGGSGASASGGSGASASGDSKKKNHPTMPSASASDESNLNDVVKSAAQERAEEEVGEQQVDDIKKEIANCGISGINITRPIHVTAEMKEQYKSFTCTPENLLKISKNMQRQMMAILKNQIDGGKLTGLPIGNKISTRDLVRDDEFIFSKERAPQDKSDLAVCILVDESASMCGENNIAAIKTSIILEDFLRNMNIPCCIYGHTTARGDCELRLYSEFDRVDNKDRYRLTEMSATGGTPTAAALTACYNHIKNRKEQSKLIIVITDGMPGDNNKGQIQSLIKAGRHKGVEVFGVGIAGAAKNLYKIYEERTIAIDDLNLLPKQMIRLIKRYIRFV